MKKKNDELIANAFPANYDGIFKDLYTDAEHLSLEALHKAVFQIIFAEHLIGTKGLRLFSWQKKHILKELNTYKDYILGKKYLKLMEAFKENPDNSAEVASGKNV